MIYLKLFIEFFKIGIFTYGGGLAMLPLLQELAIKKQWLTQKEFADLFAISQSTPGPVAINLATFIGQHNGGIIGAFIASFAVVLPGTLLALVIAKFLQHFNEHPIVKSLMIGLKAAVVGLIATAVVQVGLVSLYTTDNATLWTFYQDIDIKAIFLFFVFIWAVVKYNKHPIVYILIGGVLGIFIF